MLIIINNKDNKYMFTKKVLLITVMSLSITFCACEEEKMSANMNTKTSIESIKTAQWENLAQKKIFFGHQSVGNNIISGIKDLMKTNNTINLHIVETENPGDFSSGIFAHHGVGQNVDSESKIKDFVRMIDQGIGGKADIAFFKFCYIDFTAETNIQGIFNDYKNAMTSLKNKYPDTQFIHCTVPLVTKVKISPISILKTMLGRDGNRHNVARNEFNELMRKEYGGKELIFDLAVIESTYPDGSKETFEKDGKTYYSLIPQYSDDGGHLNELGRRRAAEYLLMFLVNL